MGCAGQDAEKGNATGWDVYVRRGFGGPLFWGRVNNGDAAGLNWMQGSNGLSAAFANGPDFNSAYSFRVVRLDGKISPDDFFDQRGWVGFNLKGGNNVSLSQPAMPNLQTRKVCVYDDIFGGDDLAPMGKSIVGQDIDESNWRALQLVWNFEANAEDVQDYRVLIREQGQEQFQSLGQTNSGCVTYFWWTQDQAFYTAPEFKDGPQNGKVYQFRVVKFAFDGSRDAMNSGWVKYSVLE
ncbi:MAG: hypothetical protein AB1656_12830, partial [Candidatus Omnitrophota bacterium]